MSTTKNCKTTIFIAFILSCSVIADVPYVGYEEGRYLGNLEIIGCLEIDKNPNPISTLIWIGYAYVYPFEGDNHTHGYESAIEIRLKKNAGYLSSHMFVSSYFGLGNMYLIEYYRGRMLGRKWYPGLSTGLKCGYNFAFLEWKLRGALSNLSLEPYSGISLSNGYGGNVKNPLVTIGLRIVTNFKLIRYAIESNEIQRQ